jgi:uncharacterized protein YcnI
MTSHLIASAAALLALSAGAAFAHVTLADPQAPVGAYYTSAFKVTHGCAGAATTALRIEIPAAVAVAKPQPKPGWTLEIEHAPLATPMKGEGGVVVTQRVKSITWRGRLPDEDWDQFGIFARLPEAPGKLYFPAVQTCETGEERWVEVPAAGETGRLAHPAPALTVTPRLAPDPMAGMAGMDMHH